MVGVRPKDELKRKEPHHGGHTSDGTAAPHGSVPLYDLFVIVVEHRGCSCSPMTPFGSANRAEHGPDRLMVLYFQQHLHLPDGQARCGWAAGGPGNRVWNDAFQHLRGIGTQVAASMGARRPTMIVLNKRGRSDCRGQAD